MPVFLFTDYYITVGKELLSSVIEKDVIDGVSVSTTKTLAYNTNNILKSTHIVNSSGESVIDEIKYPFDDGYQSQTVYLKMMSLNMLNFPVKQTIKRNGKSNSISTAYMDFGTNFIKPSQILTQKDNNPEELRIQYHRYDSYGNPVYITKDNATKVVYIWGYKGLYPVAEIKNATYEEVQRALGGTAPESLSTNVTFNSSIDGLRTNSNLTNAQVSIYKYKPLVGLVSVTDPTGLTTNYTYDAFNRLIEVSFLEGTTKRVTESYNYNYRTN